MENVIPQHAEAETRARITRALQEGAVEQRQQVLDLLEEGEFSVEEMANRLDLTRGQVRARLAELREAGRVTARRLETESA